MGISRAFRVSTLAGLFVSGVLSGGLLFGADVRGQDSSTATQLQKAVDELMAKEAIREQIYNYSRGLDRMDKPLALQVWHPDGTTDNRGSNFKGTGAGFIEWVWGQHASMIAHTHQMTNMKIRVDGDKAASETYAIATLRSEQKPGSYNTTVVQARYMDRWSKRNGRWAIDHRMAVSDFITPHVTVGPSRPSASRRDRTDLSYQVLP